MGQSQRWTPEAIQKIVDELKHKPGALLPVLHAIQDKYGYIAEEAVPVIAHGLALTRAEVHGVISFYHHFRMTPPGKHIVQICRAEACQSMGARGLEAYAKDALNIDYHQTTADRSVSLEAVYCLGNCATAPSVRIDNDIYGRVDKDRFDELIAQCRNDVGREAV